MEEYLRETPMLDFSTVNIQQLISDRKLKEIDTFHRIKQGYFPYVVPPPKGLWYQEGGPYRKICPCYSSHIRYNNSMYKIFHGKD